MDKRTNRNITDFVSKVSETFPLNSAYLFGSYAKKQQHINSDIDIALIIDNMADTERFDVQVQLMLLASTYDTRIEPHPISKQEFTFGNPFANEITTTGQLIHYQPTHSPIN